MGKPIFNYRFNGELTFAGRTPFFEHGEIRLTAELKSDTGEFKQVTKTLLGLKGRPYLKLTFNQHQDTVKLNKELFGLHPNHIFDRAKNIELHNEDRLELVTDKDTQEIENGILNIDPGVTGIFSIIATFDGDLHYEPTSRKINSDRKEWNCFSPP